MTMSRFSKALCAIAVLAMALTPHAVMATDAPSGGTINVSVNMARILRISSPAATVIIGNPGVADVTIQDPQTLVLTGKSYGQTNLIILDSMGNPIADTLIEVMQAQSGMVTMYIGAARATIACAPVCQPTIMLGDDAAIIGQAVTASRTVQSAAASE